MPPVRATLTLTSAEKDLFETLLSAVRHHQLKTTLRCAGGWVRDKLLGLEKEAPDVDIALDDMLGKEFAEKVNEYLTSKGEEVHTIAVIQTNPDQSKHLETARMKIHGLWIDLVNLRSETYAAGSRIPTMEFGTPEQDALRRDLTINSLFYNLNTGTVEDFTGQGVLDLREGLIRTPLPPRETFLDDPLRALRAVRFASRLGFSMDPSLVEAAGSDAVRTSLAQKVSRERVGAELDGMLGGPDPVSAMGHLDTMRLIDAVLSLPPDVRPLLGDSYSRPLIACMDAAEAVRKALQGGEVTGGEKEGGEMGQDDRRVLYLAALTLPLRRLQTKGPKGKPLGLPPHIIKESLRFRAKDGDLVSALHAEAPLLLEAAAALRGAGGVGGAGADLRVTLGMAVRRLGPSWPLGCLLAPLLLLQESSPLGEDPASSKHESAAPAGMKRHTWAAADVAEEGPAASLAETSRQLLAAVRGLGLEGAHEMKAVVDGRTAMQVLGVKGGPLLGSLLQRGLEYQLGHPGAGQDEVMGVLRGWMEEQGGKGGKGKA